MEREAANREEEEGNVSLPGALDGLETSVRKRLHVKQLTNHTLKLKSHSHIDPRAYFVVFSLSPNSVRLSNPH